MWTKFVAGDMHRGQSLVVWAIREGREAAGQVDRDPMGYTNCIKYGKSGGEKYQASGRQDGAFYQVTKNQNLSIAISAVLTYNKSISGLHFGHRRSGRKWRYLRNL